MNPNPYAESPMWDDEIDLRQLIETLLDRKWMITGIIALSVLIAAVFSYFILPPRYEASAVVALPAANTDQIIGMSAKAYEAFALNERVLGAMILHGDLDISSRQVHDRLKISLDSQSRLFTVTAHAEEGAEAHHLVHLWLMAFQEQLTDYARDFVTTRLSHAESNVRLAESEVNRTAMELEQFIRDSELLIKEARLKRWQDSLISIESRLHELKEQLIPAAEGRVAHLETALASVAPTLDSETTTAIFPSNRNTTVGVTATDVVVLNPVHLELSQELARTRTRLVDYEQEATLLQSRLAKLPDQVQQLQVEVTQLRLERTRLQDEVAIAEQMYVDAHRNRQTWSVTNANLEEATALTVVAAPIVPAGPVAPRKMLNIALAAFLGAFVGIGVALFQHFWHETSKPAEAV